jgi:hypothetical protein
MNKLNLKFRNLKDKDYLDMEDGEKETLLISPITTDRYYEYEILDDKYYLILLRESKVKVPKSWMKKAEPLSDLPTPIYPIKGSSNYESKKKEWIKKNPGGTTLPEYQKNIDKNTEKAREAKAKSGLI